MRGRPAVGERVTHEVVVGPEMTARLFGREVHPLYATAWMVRHAEEAGRLLVERHLAAEEDATGRSISVVHLRPVPVGERLRIEAVVTRVDEREVETAFEVHGERGLVGRGNFVQRYVRRGYLAGGTDPDGRDP
jgi:fluoroacetyl-CoA thioesterase